MTGFRLQEGFAHPEKHFLATGVFFLSSFCRPEQLLNNFRVLSCRTCTQSVSKTAHTSFSNMIWEVMPYFKMQTCILINFASERFDFRCRKNDKSLHMRMRVVFSIFIRTRKKNYLFNKTHLIEWFLHNTWIYFTVKNFAIFFIILPLIVTLILLYVK